jgi:ligand-binding sensor domain-containing protein
MDIGNLIASARNRFNHNSAKKYLQEKYESKLIIAEQGGLWKITPELIAVLAIYPSKTLILQDMYGNPIQVNKNAFLSKASSVYDSVMTEYKIEYDELQSKR